MNDEFGGRGLTAVTSHTKLLQYYGNDMLKYVEYDPGNGVYLPLSSLAPLAGD